MFDSVARPVRIGSRARAFSRTLDAPWPRPRAAAINGGMRLNALGPRLLRGVWRQILVLALCAQGCDTKRTVVFVDGAAGDASGGRSPTPPQDASWQIQLTQSVDTSLDVSLWVIDSFLDPALVTRLKDAGRHVACYVSVGTFEPWREDADRFPQEAIGRELADYPDESWLDVRNETVRSLMAARLDALVRQGCDSVQASSLDGHSVDSGFALTLSDDLDYARFLSSEAHGRGLGFALTTSGELVGQAQPYADWGLAEQCLANADCGSWSSFAAARKPVFMVEFGAAEDAPALCAGAQQLGYNLLIKRRALDGFRIACPAP